MAAQAIVALGSHLNGSCPFSTECITFRNVCVLEPSSDSLADGESGEDGRWSYVGLSTGTLREIEEDELATRIARDSSLKVPFSEDGLMGLVLLGI